MLSYCTSLIIDIGNDFNNGKVHVIRLNGQSVNNALYDSKSLF